MKDSSWIVAILLLGIIGITIQNFFLMQRMDESEATYEQHLDDVYF